MSRTRTRPSSVGRAPSYRILPLIGRPSAAETILLRDGELMEASASAVHIVIGGELLEPPNSRRILPGTTRGVVEEMAARLGIVCRAAPISESQLRAADEINAKDYDYKKLRTAR